MSWLVYKRGTIEPFRASLPLLAIFRFDRHDNGAKQPRTLYINEGDKLHWSWDKEEFNRFWTKQEEYFKSPAKIARHFQRVDKAYRSAISASQKVLKADLRRLDNKQLIGLQAGFSKNIWPAHFMLNTEVDAVDIYFENFLRARIAKELKGRFIRSHQEEIYKTLTKPVSRSYINKQEREIYQAALKKDFSYRTAKKIYDKFWWTNLGWENMSPHTPEYFARLIKKLSRTKNLAGKAKHLDDFIKDNKRERSSCLKELGSSKNLKYYLSLCDQYIDYHDKRKEVQVRTVYSFTLILAEIARRSRLKLADLEWLWIDEAVALLKGAKIDRSEIARRRRCVAALVGFRKFQCWSGEAAVRIKDKAVKEKERRLSEIKGLGVTGGIIIGRAKVCAGAKEALAKVRKGDILVCPMTLPDYLPAMRKAAAIVTEEGGVTCHAAVIAREFKIPCVVGTRIATQALKDDDRLEVDAAKGVVKILKTA